MITLSVTDKGRVNGEANEDVASRPTPNGGTTKLWKER